MRRKEKAESQVNDMEQNVNIPIQMISVCSTVGELTPMRFRFENEDHTIETVHVDEVLGRKDTNFNGIREIQYTCRADIGGMCKLFILKYSISTTRWRLSQILS